MQAGMPGQPPAKKGMSTGMIVLIVVGVILVLIMGTCAVGAFFIKREVNELGKELADGGGMVLVSPPAVTQALTTTKKDYVGAWKSKRGSTLDINADGSLKFEKDEDGDGMKEKLEAPIAAFSGNDIQMQMLLTITIHVKEAPHQVGGKWEMTADDVHLTR